MVRSDLSAVSSIEQQISSGWSQALIAEELQRDDSLVLVISRDEQVTGWVCSRFVANEAELLKITISEDQRRQGDGSLLLSNLFSSLRSRSIDKIFLEVRSANHSARSFYLSHGFTDTGRRINYYRQPTDDAVLMKKNLLLG